MSSIKAGGVFVEIGADPRQFFRTLNRVNKAMANMGRSLASAGAKVGGMGVATLAPFAAAVRAGAGYQNTLLNIQASTGATAAELDRLKAASMEMSAAMGRGPTEVANSFLELLKAGMSVEQVLGGAGKAAIEFAAVGQMDVAEAAVVMADAMNVFGVDASKAANSISAAADASSTSIELMAQSFAQVSAVAALANQSIDQTSAALAILANNGVKGSDAGTSVKTMLMRLMAPADDAVDALGQLGLSVQSFRNADGKMKPLVDIIGVLNGALGNMDQAAKDDIFRRIFGQDAIRAAAILTSAGVDGFNAMTTAMGDALPVGEKYKTLMSGLAGAGQQVMSAMQRFAIAVSDAVAPAFMDLTQSLLGSLNWLTSFARDNPQVVQQLAQGATAAMAFGGAMVGVGTALRIASFSLGGFLQAGKLIASPFLLVSATAQTLGKTLAIVGVQIAAFSAKGIAAVSQFVAVTTAQLAISAARSGAVATNYFAGTISIMSATLARAAEGNFKAAAIGIQAMTKLGASGAKTLLALSGPATDAAGAVLRIGTTAAVAGKSTVGALTVAAGGAMSLARTATQTTTALALVGTTATATGALTVASLGKSIAATLAYAATSISSAGASAAAWAAANVPLLALVGIVGGAVFAFSQLFNVAAELGGWMKDGFRGAVADSVTVFSDMKRIALDAFTAVTDAMAAGDMALAMKAAMLGVQAEFQRGVNALLSKTSEFSANILNTLDAYWTSIRQPLILTSSMSPELVEDRKALQQRQDERLRNAQQPGGGAAALAELESKLAAAKDEAASKRADKDMADAASARLSSAKNLADVDLARQQIAVLLDRDTLNADVEQRLVDEFNKRWEEMSRGPEALAASIPTGAQATGPEGISAEAYKLGVGIGAAVDMKQLHKYGKQLSDMIESDKLSVENENFLLDAFREAQTRIADQESMRFGAPQMQAEAVGTFSSVGLGGMGFGASLAQKQLDELKGIHNELKKDNGPEVQE